MTKLVPAWSSCSLPPAPPSPEVEGCLEAKYVSECYASALLDHREELLRYVELVTKLCGPRE